MKYDRIPKDQFKNYVGRRILLGQVRADWEQVKEFFVNEILSYDEERDIYEANYIHVDGAITHHYCKGDAYHFIKDLGEAMSTTPLSRASPYYKLFNPFTLEEREEKEG